MESLKLSFDDKKTIRDIVAFYYPEYTKVTFGSSMLDQESFLFFWKKDIVNPHIDILDCKIHWHEFIHYHAPKRIGVEQHNITYLNTLVAKSEQPSS